MADPLTAETAPPDIDRFALPRATVAAVFEALETRDRQALGTALDDAHAADIADLLEQMRGEDRRTFFEAIGEDLDPDVLTELEEGARDEVLGIIDPEILARAVADLDTDDAVYLIEDLEDDQRQDVLDSLDRADRQLIEQSLDYPEYSAGRMMQRDLVAVPSFWTVGQVIDYMRASEDLPDPFYEIFITDPAHRPVGTVGLSTVMGARRPATMDGLMDPDFRSFTVEQPQEDVAYAFNQYHLISAPVVDEAGRLVGMITIDDAMKALEDEAEEDLLRLGGVGDEEISDSVRETAIRRFPWLFVNLLTAIFASAVISVFDGVIEQVVALAVLMTIVASMGGNAGTQTLTVAVRSLATKDLTRTNALRIVGREAAVGIVNGVVFAVLIGGAAALWYGDPMLGVVLAAAMVVNMLIAALAGILIPMGLDKAGADPALASGVFVTTVTDVVGFFVFLGLAAALLL